MKKRIMWLAASCLMASALLLAGSGWVVADEAEVVTSSIASPDAWAWQNPLPQGQRLSGVWGSSSSDVFAVGGGGTILHYDGSTWSLMSSGTTQLRSVWGSSSSDVFAVGWDGTILHYDGSTWSSMSRGTTEPLYDVWGSSSSDVFAVGSEGTILHCCEEHPTPTPAITPSPTPTQGPAAGTECGNFDRRAEEQELARRIPAYQIEEALRQGCNINAQQATIEGDLAVVADTISGKVDFTEAVFEGDVYFSGSNFESNADFTFAKFERNTYFDDTSFESLVSFRSATFEGVVSFMNAKFKSERDCFVEAAGGCANFRKASFKDNAYFSGATFHGCPVFSDSAFEGLADFKFATFNADTIFSLTTFGGDADFQSATFDRDAVFSQVTVYGDAKFFNANFKGRVWPPNRVGGATDLVWHDVKNTIPEEDRTEIYAAWETVFSSGGQFASARQVRTVSLRYELRPFVYSVLASFFVVLFIFTGVYYQRFSGTRRSLWLHHLGKVFLFSLDVLTPGIGPWKYDWKHQSGLPVERVTVLTAIESAVGWLLLTLGSALAVVWLTA